MKNAISSNEVETLRIYRLLKPEYQTKLLSLVHLACFAENSARKSLGFDPIIDPAFIMKPQEYSCKK